MAFLFGLKQTDMAFYHIGGRKNYQPSIEVDEAESAIYNRNLTDVTDIIAEMMRDLKQNNGR